MVYITVWVWDVNDLIVFSFLSPRDAESGFRFLHPFTVLILHESGRPPHSYTSFPFTLKW